MTTEGSALRVCTSVPYGFRIIKRNSPDTHLCHRKMPPLDASLKQFYQTYTPTVLFWYYASISFSVVQATVFKDVSRPKFLLIQRCWITNVSSSPNLNWMDPHVSVVCPFTCGEQVKRLNSYVVKVNCCWRTPAKTRRLGCGPGGRVLLRRLFLASVHSLSCFLLPSSSNFAKEDILAGVTVFSRESPN
jgi:hypothetical protein